MAALLLVTLILLPPPTSGAETARTQTYPSRPIRILVGQQPGTPSDIIARLVAEKLTGLWTQSVVVENQPGASGTIGAELASRAPANGYTLLVASHSNLVLARVAGNNLRYDPLLDFAPIGRIAYVPFVLAVNQNVPANTISELVAFAKAHPGQLSYATAGSGTMSQLGIELLKAATGVDLLAVHYRGASSALVDVIAGRVDMMLVDYAILAPHVRSGALRVLGSGGRLRATAAPDVPTIAEQGIPGFAVNTWYGLVAPAKTPPEILSKLNTEVNKALNTPVVREQMAFLGNEPIGSSQKDCALYIRTQLEKLREAVKLSGATPED